MSLKSLTLRIVRRRRKELAAAKSTATTDAWYPSDSFLDFVKKDLGVTLTPGQRVLCGIAFDGMEPCEFEGNDRELARQIFGDIETVPPGARNVLAALCGARAGKSYILCALRLLHLSLTVDLSMLAPGEVASGPIVAPDLRLARQTLRYIIGAVDAAPGLAAMVRKQGQDALTLLRPDGAVVTMECLPATRGGSAVRGRALFGAILEEACFFRDSNSVINDDEIFKAVAPRIVPAGQLIIASTPWSESGLLFTLYERNWGSPTDALAAHAPTLLLRNDEHTRELVEQERERDPDNAAREFDAVPMVSGTSDFFDLQAIKQCEDDTMPLVLNPQLPQDANAAIGLDTGFRKDPSAGVVVRRSADMYEVAECVEIRPPKGGRLIPSATLQELFRRAKHHRCAVAVADGHYIETVREHSAGIDLQEAPAGVTGKVDVYTFARRLINEGKVRIPAGNKRLLAQLRQVVQKPTPGGQLSITSPRRGGAHGDLASAFVLALWVIANTGSYDRMLQTMKEMGIEP